MDKAIKQRQEQIETALREIVDAIEGYFLAAPFVFINGEEAAPGEYILPDKQGRFGCFSWTDAWTEALCPWVKNEEDLRYASQHSGFILGVLVGCKAMGATRDELTAKARGFVLQTIGHAQWEKAQAREKPKGILPSQLPS